MPSDAPDLPDAPDDGYEGPAAFADIGDGYPIELGPDKPDSPAHGGKPDAPLTPINARRLLHPLPPAPASDHDWDEFGPARTDWRKLMPLAVTLAAAIGLGTWLALVPIRQLLTEPGEAASYAQHTPPSRRSPTIAEPRPSPTRTSASPRATISASLRPSRASSATTSASSSAEKPSRRPTSRPSKRATGTPTVTGIKTSRAAPTRTVRTPAPRHGGPEEPPGTPFAPACLTWAECHDEPPPGNR
ncbi:hypothetical protein ACQEUU_33815 [Nonomuraea sp. CA-218870]|uniref:hypothetical protein n=1 Tax=Nonomuraea sp. CA-218870 TaxID=3239998 RepID=UPI003D8D6ED3